MGVIFSYCFPAPPDRVPITVWRLPYLFLHILLLLTLGALARRPGTHLLRLALFPFSAILSFRIVFGMVWTDVPMNGLKFCAGLCIPSICS